MVAKIEMIKMLNGRRNTLTDCKCWVTIICYYRAFCYRKQKFGNTHGTMVNAIKIEVYLTKWIVGITNHSIFINSRQGNRRVSLIQLYVSHIIGKYN